MTVEELAAKLRMHMFRDGQEYILDHDPIDMAQQALTGYAPEVPPSGQPSEELLAKLNQGWKPLPAPEYVSGPDNRVSYDHAAVSWPAMTAFQYDIYYPTYTSHCTATSIGIRMLVTAAHCFVDARNQKTSTNISVLTPYWSDTDPQDQWGAWTNGVIYTHSGYTLANPDPQFDFARIVLPANALNGWGWVSPSASASYKAPGTVMVNWGFSKDKNYQLWLKQGTVGATDWLTAACARRVATRQNADVTQGDSGSGALVGYPSSGYPYLVGINVQEFIHDYTIDHSCDGTQGKQAPYCYYANNFRNWDATTYAFYSSGGYWP